MDYKQVLKLASAKQESVKELAASSVLLKDIGPPKKEERSSKGVNSPGVKAFLEKLNKSGQNNNAKQVSKMSNSNAKTQNVSSALSDDFDIDNLFKKSKRVALLPDSAVLDMMEISKLRNQHIKDKQESQKVAALAREAKEKANREKQREKEKAELDKKETLKRVMNILNRDQQAAVKRPGSGAVGQPEAKKSKLAEKSQPPTASRMPRKDGAKSLANRPPPLAFDELLKVAEKNQKEQPPEELVKEILCVDLLDSNKSKDKDQESKKGKSCPDNPKSSRDQQLRPPQFSSSNSNNNVVKKPSHPPPTSASGSLKSKHSAPNGSVQSHGAAAIKKTSNDPVRNVQTNSAMKTSSISMAARQPDVRLPKKDSGPFGQRTNQPKIQTAPRGQNGVTQKKPPNAGSRSSAGPSPDDRKVVETIAKSLEGASDSMKKDLMELLRKYQSERNQGGNNNGGGSSNNNKTTKLLQKGPATNGAPRGARPSLPERTPTTKSAPVNGWERAMSALVPKSQKSADKNNRQPNGKRRAEDYGDDYCDEEEDDGDDMSDFIDDTEADIDYSSHIKTIFNYDKSRYSKYDEDDDDDECMESNHREIEREERISAKIGMMEDLEDMRMEQEELRRKKLKKVGKR